MIFKTKNKWERQLGRQFRVSSGEGGGREQASLAAWMDDLYFMFAQGHSLEASPEAASRASWDRCFLWAERGEGCGILGQSATPCQFRVTV